MNHIKLFESFESESFEDIIDICLELEDDGFIVKKSNFGLSIYKMVFTNVYKIGNFKYSEVEEVVERIKNYIGDNFSGIRIDFTLDSTFGNGGKTNNDWVNFGQETIPKEPFSNPIYTLDRICGVIIEYKRNINESLNFFNKRLSQETIDDIKDICLELSDDRFIIQAGDGTDSYEVFISKDNHDPFSYNIVKEAIERLKDYLGNSIQSVLVMSRGDIKWINADLLSINNNNKHLYISSSVRVVKIIIKP